MRAVFDSSTTRLTTSSWTDDCTSSRDPAIQV
ncbi:Uncharacterised protein [Mycobacteroides abscessus subsp. abscessus]|nr:Uncharacterised protein [Mycobacteroides abscessus subsp. abscessus]